MIFVVEADEILAGAADGFGGRRGRNCRALVCKTLDRIPSLAPSSLERATTHKCLWLFLSSVCVCLLEYRRGEKNVLLGFCPFHIKAGGIVSLGTCAGGDGPWAADGMLTRESSPKELYPCDFLF